MVWNCCGAKGKCTKIVVINLLGCWAGRTEWAGKTKMSHILYKLRYLTLICPRPFTQQSLIFLISKALFLPECHIVGTFQYAAFSVGLLSLSDTHFSLLNGFALAWESISFYCWIALLYGCPTVCLSVNLLKNSLVACDFQ